MEVRAQCAECTCRTLNNIEFEEWQPAGVVMPVNHHGSLVFSCADEYQVCVHLTGLSCFCRRLRSVLLSSVRPCVPPACCCVSAEGLAAAAEDATRALPTFRPFCFCFLLLLGDLDPSQSFQPVLQGFASSI